MFVVGAGALTMALSYRTGTATQMGPGYFPAIVAGLLALVGLTIIGRAMLVEGARLERVKLRPLLLIVAATLVFAFALKPLGLVPAIFILVLVSSAASAQFSLARCLPLAAGLALACDLLFVRFLGLPLQPFGPLISEYSRWTSFSI